MKVTESRSGAHCTLTAGESVVLLRLKEQQKGIWLVEELKLDRTQTETVLQEAMQRWAIFCAGRRCSCCWGAGRHRAGLPDTRSRTCWRRRSRQSPASDRGTYSRSAVLPLRTVKLFGGSVYIFLCGRLQVKDFFLAQTAADDSRRAYDQRTGRHDGVLGDQRACCD